MKSRNIKKCLSSVLSIILCISMLLTAFPLTASATNGNWTGGQVDRGYRLKVVYSESAQNPKTNTSKVTATLYLVQDRTYSLYIGTRSATITINGVKTTISNIPAIQNNGGVTTTLGSANTTVTHTSDGSKSITIAATFNMNATLSGTYYGTMSTSKTVALDKLDRTAPTVSLSYNSSTTSSIKFNASANVSCDIWQYSLDSGSWTSFGSTGTSNTLTISNLTSGSTHSVKVRARKASNTVYGTSSSKSASVKPGNPGNLSVTNITSTSAKLNWGSVSGATSYKAYKDGAVVSSSVTTNNYNFTGLTPNTTYTLGVAATNSGGSSSIINKNNVLTKPGIPENLTTANQTYTQLDLSWSAPTGGTAESLVYEVYRDNILLATISDLNYTDITYENTDSTYTVCAVNSAGKSVVASIQVNSNEEPEITLISTIHDHTYTKITANISGGIGQLTLKWAYGNRDNDYFENNGNVLDNNQDNTYTLYVTRNGTYTFYVIDSQNASDLKTITISDIYTDNIIGSYTQTFTDLSVDSVGIPVSFERTYNSMDTTSNLFGTGWSLNYAKKTVLSNDGNVRLVYLPDSSVNYFRVNADNTYSPIRSQNTLVANGNTLTLSVKDGYIYTYTDGYLTSIKDAHNNEIVIELNSDNLPRKIIDSVGREYNITYSSNNKISCITDPAGRTITYTYNGAGFLDVFNSFGNISTEQYFYTDGLLTKILDLQSNQSTEITYYSNSQVASLKQDEETTYYSYSVSANGQTSINETTGEKSIINEYDSLGQIITDSNGYAYIYNNDGTIASKAALNTDHIIIRYSYDNNGNLIEERTVEIAEDTVTEILKEIISYIYTYFENTDEISSANETTISYTYDENNVPSTDSTTVLRTYNIYGELLSEQTTHNDDTDNKTYSYLTSGLLSTETADGKAVEYTYNTNGYATNVRTIENNIETNVSISYNIIGQVLSQAENGLTVTNIYDLFGNVIKTTQSDGNTTRVSRIVYDDHNRIVQKIGADQYSENDDRISPDSNGICSSNTYNNANVGERYTYDDNGNVLTYVNKANNKTVNTYDSENRLVKTVTYETQSETSSKLTTRYVYNADGDLIQTVYPHQYNSANDNLDVANGINEYNDNTIGERVAYDENGNIVSYTDSFGKQTVNTYDAKNHLVKSVTDGETTRFVYNGGDNLLQVIYSDQYVAADDNLDLTAETPVDTYSDSTIGDRYTYDDDGNVLTYTDRFSNITTNTYDSDGNLTATTKPDGAVFSYNKDGKVTSETYSNGLVNNYTYTANQTVVSGSNGITVTYNQNGFGEVAEYLLQNGENNKNYAYTYDSNGNILTISLNNTLQQTFTYNDSNELARVDDAVANKTTAYEYDYVGNITSVKTYLYTTGTLGTPLTTQNYTYNSQNQRTDLSYDANGNITSLNGYTFGWTNRRLTSATSTDNSISYTYNYDGIRTSKTVNGTTINYTVDVNNNVIEQTDDTNTIKFVYDNSNSPIYMEYNGVTYYYEKNLQGDIVAILDANGNTVVEYSYDIWGKLLGITGELADTLGVANPLRYRGYYYDNETGLYYLQSRYYSPDLMRFISQDDAKLSNTQGQPLGSNLYTYCLNNPVMNVDPTGKLPIWAKITIGIVGIAASVALTIATGGAALPALIATLKFVAGSVAISMAIEGLIGYLTGGTAGLKEGLINGAADGFMWGGIGAAVSAAAKAIRVFKTGKAISSACFVAGTLIATENNFVPIEQIQQGDLVWAENPETGEKSLKPVVATFVRETYEFVHIQVDGQNITTTPEHPFWVSQKGWTDATNLRVGDYLVLQNGKSAIIEFVQHESLEIPAIVYNFEVEDFHTYYVTDSAVLVHNKCGMGNFRTLKETTIKGYKVSMDLERGGSGLLNIHLKVNKTKYFWNGKQFVSSAGKAIPNSLKNNAKIQKALQKALEAIAKGRL